MLARLVAIDVVTIQREARDPLCPRHVRGLFVGADEEEIGDPESSDGGEVQVQGHVDVAVVDGRQHDQFVLVAHQRKSLFV